MEFHGIGWSLDDQAEISFLNYYDNKLYIPKNVINTQSKVYVRHVDANSGKSIGKNENEILISGETKSIKSNAGLPKMMLLQMRAFQSIMK